MGSSFIVEIGKMFFATFLQVCIEKSIRFPINSKYIWCTACCDSIIELFYFLYSEKFHAVAQAWNLHQTAGGRVEDLELEDVAWQLTDIWWIVFLFFIIEWFFPSGGTLRLSSEITVQVFSFISPHYNKERMFCFEIYAVVKHAGVKMVMEDI